jgi:hypothetical protein
MDTFVEQLVKKAPDGKTTALKVLVAFAMVVLCALCLLAMFMGFAFAIMVAAGVIYGGIYLITGFDAEYEYIVTNGEIDIDKIIAKRKRKRLITAKASKFDSFGKLSGAKEPSKDATVVKVDGTGTGAGESYYADFTHSAMGSVRLIFTPDERVIEGIVPYLPRLTRAEYERSGK